MLEEIYLEPFFKEYTITFSPMLESCSLFFNNAQTNASLTFLFLITLTSSLNFSTITKKNKINIDFLNFIKRYFYLR